MLKLIFDKYYKITKGKYPFFLYCPNSLKEYYLIKRYHDIGLTHIKNFKEPKTFNEKIRYLINHEKVELKSKLSDKIYVKEYVKEKLGNDYCSKIYGIWDKFSEKEFNGLPERFALKANHGSKMNIFVIQKNLTPKIKKKHS